MKNYILNFDKMDLDGFTLESFTDIPVIPSWITDNADYYTYIEIEDNEKIEYVSFELYNVADYWDILIVLNNMKDPLELPKSLDFIINRVNNKIDEYMNYYKIANEKVRTQRYNLEIDIEQKKNEKFRMIKVVKPEKLVEFLRDLRKAGI